jgi:hypothetical protein
MGKRNEDSNAVPATDCSIANVAAFSPTRPRSPRKKTTKTRDKTLRNNQKKKTNFVILIARHKEVFRLDISMNHVLPMDVSQSRCNLEDKYPKILGAKEKAR